MIEGVCTGPLHIVCDKHGGRNHYQRLLQRGVIVRPVANYGLPEFLRVTVGLPAENQRFLDAVAAALAG